MRATQTEVAEPPETPVYLRDLIKQSRREAARFRADALRILGPEPACT